MAEKNISTRCPDEIINDAMKSIIEMRFLRDRALNMGWDADGEADISGLASRAEKNLEDLISEISRMKNSLIQIDNDAASWHEKISMNVCVGIYPNYLNR